MKRFVLDASVTMSWCFEDQQTDFGEAVLAAIGFARQALRADVVYPIHRGA